MTLAIEIFNSIADGKDGTADTIEPYSLPDHGYFVGGVGEPLVFDTPEDANTSAALRAITAFVTGTSARFVGWWTDSETGKVYVDGTSWHSSEFEAGAAGLERREIAIYDIARQRELRLVHMEEE